MLSWIKKFCEFSGASKSNPKLLVLDGHVTHVKNLEVIKYAESNGITMVQLSPHTSHKMQPLDVGFMRSLSLNYTEALRRWLRKHPRATVSMAQIFSLFGEAFLEAAKMSTAIHAFECTGIHPFNSKVFSKEDFVKDKEEDSSDEESESAKVFNQVLDKVGMCAGSSTEQSTSNVVHPSSSVPKNSSAPNSQKVPAKLEQNTSTKITTSAPPPIDLSANLSLLESQ